LREKGNGHEKGTVKRVQELPERRDQQSPQSQRKKIARVGGGPRRGETRPAIGNIGKGPFKWGTGRFLADIMKKEL